MSQHPIDRSEDPAKQIRPSTRYRLVQERPIPLTRAKLVLQAAAVTDMMLVIRTTMELLHLGRAEATHRMWQAYHCGRSQLLMTTTERAELYLEQFASKGVNVVLEPVS